MVSKNELQNLEMSYPLKINRLIRGSFISPCPDCKTPHTEDVMDCDKWCLMNCAHPIEREILSGRQKEIHDERRKNTIEGAIRMLAEMRENCDISDEEFRKRIAQVSDHLGKH